MITEQNSKVTRRLGTFTATSIVIANMIGTGIFTTSGLMAAHLPGSGWILLCWFVGGLIAISGALCYSELATRMPNEGGEYLYLKKLYHPLLGFLTGWTSLFVGFSAPIAASALSFSEYIFAGLNIQPTGGQLSELIVYKKLTATSIIVIFTLIHYVGLRLGAGVQNFLTVLKILIVLGLAGSGIAIGGHSNLNISFGSYENTGLLGIGTAMMLVMFSYSGWNASTYIAGELKNPQKSLPLSLFSGTIIVIILYLLINVFILNTLPLNELKNVIPVVEAASVKAFGDWIGDLLGLMIGLALLSSLSAFILIGPRVYFAMAQDRLFFAFAAKVHPRHKVPGVSILIQGTLAIIMVIIGTFKQLIIYVSFALSIFTWLAILGVFLARKKEIGKDLVVRLWGYPYIPIFYLVSTFILMVITIINQTLESFAAILTVVFGIPFYFIWLKGIKLKPKDIATDKPEIK